MQITVLLNYISMLFVDLFSRQTITFEIGTNVADWWPIYYLECIVFLQKLKYYT